MKHFIYYGQKRIEFDLILTDRKTLGISVKPDSSVYVRAPSEKPLDNIKEIVKRKAPWILRQIDRFEELRPLTTPKEYMSGESFHYLGRQYRLKVLETNDKESVKMTGGYINVWVFKKDRNRVKTLLENWYLDHAKGYFSKKVNLCYEKVKKYGIHNPKVITRKMKTRWGSCSKKGNITLNTHLIKAPSHCIEYVIMHEFCHLKYYNHSKSYYSLLSRVMPDWEMRKKRLERVYI